MAVLAENQITLVRVDDGAVGATGATGEQGPEGPRGATGAQGPEGYEERLQLPWLRRKLRRMQETMRFTAVRQSDMRC